MGSEIQGQVPRCVSEPALVHRSCRCPAPYRSLENPLQPHSLGFPAFPLTATTADSVSPIPHSRPEPKQGQRYAPDCREILKAPRAAGIMARAGAVPYRGFLGAVLAIPLLAGPAGAQQPPPQAVRQIEALLAAKAQRTPAQRKVSSQLLEAQRTPAQRTVNSQLLDEQRTPTQQKLNSQLQDALRAPLQKPTVARDLPSPSHGSGRQK